jgi:tight adherence protein C
MLEALPIVIAILFFGTVTAVAFVLARYLATQAQIQRRLPAQARAASIGQPTTALQAFVRKHFDEQRFGIGSTLRGKLRRELLKAGYFRYDALNYYIFARVVLVVILPTAAYVLLQFLPQTTPWLLKFSVVIVSLLLAILGPYAYIARRQRILTERYRRLFPDFLDLLMVCIDAGLSLQAAVDRVTDHIIKHNREFGLNLMMMGEETRAGRSTIEAFGSWAERLNLDEARSFILVLRQSIELGSDVGDALRVFGDEMRDKRLLRAEEAANKLPVKMTLPLGLFIFPVILLVILLPIVIKLLMTVLR